MMKLHRQLNVMRTANWDSCSIRYEEMAAMRDEVDARIAELTAERDRYKNALEVISEMTTWDSGLRAGLTARNALKEG